VCPHVFGDFALGFITVNGGHFIIHGGWHEALLAGMATNVEKVIGKCCAEQTFCVRGVPTEALELRFICEGLCAESTCRCCHL
jgi:hypothetical protein